MRGRSGVSCAPVVGSFNPSYTRRAASTCAGVRQLPDGSLLATHVTNGVIERSRPLCPYPQIATYKETGDTNDAIDFVCRNPN